MYAKSDQTAGEYNISVVVATEFGRVCVRIAREIYLIFSIDLHKPELAKKLGKSLVHIVLVNRDLLKINRCARVKYQKYYRNLNSLSEKAKEKANGRFFPVYLHKHTYTYTSVYAPMCACVENEELKEVCECVCSFVCDLSGEE